MKIDHSGEKDKKTRKYIMIKLDKLDLLELFDQEEIIDEQTQAYRYLAQCEDGFTLHYDISIGEETVHFKLMSPEHSLPIFDVKLEKISAITCDIIYTPWYVSHIQLYRADNLIKPVLRMYIKPYPKFVAEV